MKKYNFNKYSCLKIVTLSINERKREREKDKEGEFKI